jgi:serine acetyltransferase
LCRNNTTIGNKFNGDNASKAVIGDNVILGVNFYIIGSVHIGDNVIIGAGSVVIKDLLNNCIAVGNPARIVKYTIDESK